MDALDARILAAVSRRGRRLLTMDELLEEGVSHRQIEYRVGVAKRWRRVHPKVIDVGAGPLSRFDRVQAATLVGTNATGFTTLWLHDIGDYSPGTIEVAIGFRQSLRLDGVNVRRHRHEVPVRPVRGVPSVCIEQALIDVAPTLPPKMLHRAFTKAWRKRLTTPRRMLRYLDEHAGRGVAGGGKLRRVVALYEKSSRAPGDDYEADLLFILSPALKAAKIEAPVLQFGLKIDGGRREATIDLAWPDRGKVIEVMGLDSHGDYVAQDYDYERAAAIRRLGWDLREIAPRAIRERPEQTVRDIITWLCES